MGELGSPDILEFGHFRFDRRGRCLYRLNMAGDRMLLPAGRTALDILALLIERAGEVVESEEIRKIVWRGKTVEDANLATQVFHLRESVGRNRIQTVSGRGYRFVGRVRRLNGDPGAVLSTRRLAAILAADVVGYSRLMGADEEGTLERLKALRRQLIDPKIEAHLGRIVKTTGDGLLVEFASVVNAVRCAAEVQLGMIDREPGLPDERRIRLRIGINLGDVIAEDDDIFGDGVNVSARLEALAEPGGICISGMVHDQIYNKRSYPLEDWGTQRLKNIAQPVRVYALRSEVVTELPLSPSPPVPATPPSGARLRADRGAAPAFSSEKDEPPQPTASEQITDFDDRPAIAVLPFANLRGDPDQQHFADGITDEIITELASWRSFPVIARGSSFSFRDQAVDVANLGKQLGARYLVKGSVAKTSRRVRITVQLIDATNGQYLVVERYERNLSELFDVQDEIVQAIVGSIAPEIFKVERERVNRRQPPNPTSYEYFVRGLEYHYRYNKYDNAEAQCLFRKSIAADPKNSQAHALLAHAMLYAVQHCWREDEEHNFQVADDLAARAIALDSRAPFARFAFGSSAMFLGRTEQALVEMKEAVRLNPSHAAAHAIMAHLLCYTGRPAEALWSIERALRLSPHDPRLGLWIPAMAQAYYFLERYEDAVAASQRALSLIPGNVIATRFLAASLGQLGRVAEAAPAVTFLRKSREPTLADEKRLMDPLYRAPEKVLHVLDGLQKAGLT
jgi:adenylate cyclase